MTVMNLRKLEPCHRNRTMWSVNYMNLSPC